MKNSIAIFDLDGTLIDSNSTFDFLRYCYASDTYYKIVNSVFFRAVNKLSVRLFNWDFKRTLNLKCLKGESKESLEIKCKKFYKEYICTTRIKTEIVELYKSFVVDSKNIYIVTATLDFLARFIVLEICPEIKLDHILTTELEYKNNICTGRIQKDLLNRKLAVLKDNGILPLYSIVVSDDVYDGKLMMNSEENYIVYTNKNKKYWNDYLKKNSIKNYKIIGDDY